MIRIRRGDQIVRLRRRIVIAAFGAICAALAVICVAINIWDYNIVCERADAMIDIIHRYGEVPRDIDEGDRKLPHNVSITAETPFKTRYFIAVFDAGGALTSLDAEHLAAMDSAGQEELAREILERGERTGFYGSYRFSVFEEEGSATMIVLDCYGELEALAGFRHGSIAVCGACALIALTLLIPFSRRVVKPYAQNLASQHRFVTDASHELKTPIAIISANNDLVEGLVGESRWTRSTRIQVERLSRLVNGLVELARADEAVDEDSRAPVNLSTVVRRACAEASSLAEVEDKELSFSVEDDIVVNGSERELAALMRALLDNAVKYCAGSGPIDLTLKRESAARSRVHLVVSNPCDNLSPDDMPHLFDRFWRTDASRDRKTGGYGIGLALVQAIARKHGGGVGARLEDGRVRFTVTLPALRP